MKRQMSCLFGMTRKEFFHDSVRCWLVSEHHSSSCGWMDVDVYLLPLLLLLVYPEILVDVVVDQAEVLRGVLELHQEHRVQTLHITQLQDNTFPKIASNKGSLRFHHRLLVLSHLMKLYNLREPSFEALFLSVSSGILLTIFRPTNILGSGIFGLYSKA